MKKRILSMLLALCLLSGLLPLIETAADADFVPPMQCDSDSKGIKWRLQQIMKVIPDQTPFTVNGECCTH